MSFKQITFCGILCFFFYATSCQSQEEKHLFILSGQSNMSQLNAKTFFTPIVKNTFGKEKVIVVKDSKGGQKINQWYKKRESSPGNYFVERGYLYKRLMLKIKDSIKDQKIKSITFIWMQGESDAKNENWILYEKSLIGLYQLISEDLKSNAINFIIGRINDFDMNNNQYSNWTKIREIQVRVGESNPKFSWVNTDDLNSGIGIRGNIIINGLHLSKNGYRTLGKRFAEKAIELIKKNE